MIDLLSLSALLLENFLRCFQGFAKNVFKLMGNQKNLGVIDIRKKLKPIH